MNNVLNYLYLLLLLLFPFEGKAQQLSLNECFELGKINSNDIKIQRLKVEQKRETKRSLASHFLPEAGISASHAYNFGSSINPSNNNREPSNIQSDNVSFDLRSSVIDFSKWNETTIQNLDIEIEKQNLTIIENQYQLLILEKYMKALVLQEFTKTLQFQLKNSQELLNRINEEVAQGKRPQSDVYDIEVIYLQDKNDLEKTKQEGVLSKLELVQLLNTNNVASENLTLSFPENELMIEDNFTFDQLSSVQKTKIAIQKNKEELKQVRNSYLPTLGFNYSYGTFFAQKINNFSDTSFQFQNQLKDNKSQYLGLSLYIPIFSKGKIAQQRNLKRLEQEVLVEEETKEEKRLRDLLATYQTKLKFLNTQKQDLKQIENSSHKSFQTTTSKYLYDKIDATVFKSVKNQLLQSQYNCILNEIEQLLVSHQMKINFELD